MEVKQMLNVISGKTNVVTLTIFCSINRDCQGNKIRDLHQEKD
jgi:hypothetical protein